MTAGIEPETRVVRVLACGDCGAHQTLDPLFCRFCGSARVAWANVSGNGRVYAKTEVHRAPAPEFRELVPYTLVLVDLDGGGRVMGHGHPDLAIGSAVSATTFNLAGLPLIRFVQE